MEFPPENPLPSGCFYTWNLPLLFVRVRSWYGFSFEFFTRYTTTYIIIRYGYKRVHTRADLKQQRRLQCRTTSGVCSYTKSSNTPRNPCYAQCIFVSKNNIWVHVIDTMVGLLVVLRLVFGFLSRENKGRARMRNTRRRIPRRREEQ